MLSKSTLYVLKAFSILGQIPGDQFLGANAISEKSGIPPNYLGKMLQNLAKKGFLVSQKGLGGGFRLSRTPENISLLALIEATGQESFLQGCFWGNPQCDSKEPCPMHVKWEAIVELTRNTFETTSIADIMQKAVV